MENTSIKPEDLRKLMRDVELIKNMLMSEGELTDWAKKELSEARNRSESSYVSLETVKRKILAKK